MPKRTGRRVGANRWASETQLAQTLVGAATRVGPCDARCRIRARASTVLPSPMSSARQAPTPHSASRASQVKPSAWYGLQGRLEGRGDRGLIGLDLAQPLDVGIESRIRLELADLILPLLQADGRQRVHAQGVALADGLRAGGEPLQLLAQLPAQGDVLVFAQGDEGAVAALDLVEQSPHFDHQVLIHPHLALDLEPVLGRVDREMELLGRDGAHGDRIALGPLDGQDLRRDRLQLLQQFQGLLRIVEDPGVILAGQLAEHGGGFQRALGQSGLFLEIAVGLQGLVPHGLDQVHIPCAGRERPLRRPAQRHDDHLGLQALVEPLQAQVRPAVRLDGLGLGPGQGHVRLDRHVLGQPLQPAQRVRRAILRHGQSIGD